MLILVVATIFCLIFNAHADDPECYMEGGPVSICVWKLHTVVKSVFFNELTSRDKVCETIQNKVELTNYEYEK